MIITIGNTKGGVGKTTLAINIAIALSLQQRDILLVDGDEQRTTMNFSNIRNEQSELIKYTAVGLYGIELRTQIKKLSHKYDDIVIDCGGRDTGSMRAAMVVTDILLIPIQPRSFDVWALHQMQALITEAREIHDFHAAVILNAADNQGQDNRETVDIVKGMQFFDVLDCVIGRRKVFANAAALGKSIFEYQPRDEKAINEFLVLMQQLNHYKNIQPVTT